MYAGELIKRPLPSKAAALTAATAGPASAPSSATKPGAELLSRQAQLFAELERQPGGVSRLVVAQDVRVLATSSWVKDYAAVGFHPLARLLYKRSLAASERHLYEHLRGAKGSLDGAVVEGNVVVPLACKLYFDVEFERALNPDLGDGTVADDDEFSARVLGHIHTSVERAFGRDDAVADVFVSDASSAAKFSRHYVLDLCGSGNEKGCGGARLPLLFASVSDVHRFVQRAVLAAASYPDELLVAKRHGAETVRVTVIDGSVYSQNQLFRLLDCTKGEAPERPLRAVTLQEGEDNGDELAAADEIFAAIEMADWALLARTPCYRSLITYQPPGTVALLMRVEPGAERVRAAGGRGARFAAVGGEDEEQVTPADPATLALIAHIRLAVDPLVGGQVPCMAKHEADHQPLACQTILSSRSRECAFKGAEHGSNHIRWHVDWTHRCFWQGCFAESCLPAHDAWRAELRAHWPPPPTATNGLHWIPPAIWQLHKHFAALRLSAASEVEHSRVSSASSALKAAGRKRRRDEDSDEEERCGLSVASDECDGDRRPFKRARIE